jgi:hypothetical protein
MNQYQEFAFFWNLAAFSEQVDETLLHKKGESNVLSFGSQQ